MDNNDLIQQARGLCEGTSTNYYTDVLVPQLCDALDAAKKEIERFNGDYDEAIRAYCEWFDETQKATARAEKAEAELSELCLEPVRLCAKVGEFTIVGADFDNETITLQKTKRFEKDWEERHGCQLPAPPEGE